MAGSGRGIVAVALTAAANGREKMEEFNRTYGHKLILVGSAAARVRAFDE